MSCVHNLRKHVTPDRRADFCVRVSGNFCGSSSGFLPENETGFAQHWVFEESVRGCLVEGLTAASEVGKRGQTEVDGRERERERERELVESRRWLLRTCTKAEIKVGFNKRGEGREEDWSPHSLKNWVFTLKHYFEFEAILQIADI